MKKKRTDIGNPHHHGEFYWCIKTRLAKTEYVYLQADSIEVTASGALVCHGPYGINYALSEWEGFYQASPADDGALSVQKTEENR